MSVRIFDMFLAAMCFLPANVTNWHLITSPIMCRGCHWRPYKASHNFKIRMISSKPHVTAQGLVLLSEAALVVMVSAITNHSERVQWRRHRLLRDELARLRCILADLLPAHMAETLGGPGPHAVCEIPRKLCLAAVLQTDICGFTALSQSLPPMEVAQLVHRIFSSFDSAVRELGLFKMDTVGDAYIVAGFLPPSAAAMHDTGGAEGNSTVSLAEIPEEHLRGVCQKIMQLAAAVLGEMSACRRDTGVDIHARIGVAFGPVVVGVLGRLQPRVHILGQVSRTD